MALVELTVNRQLLDVKFEGYKLSLEPIPVLKQAVVGSVKPFCSHTGEYSYLKLHMSSHFNHLFQDFWSSSVFYISEMQSIIWSSLIQDGHLALPQNVWQLPSEDEPKANTTVMFPSTDWAVVCNGKNTLYLLHTVSRAAGEPWILSHRYIVPECVSPCYLMDAVHMLLPGRQQIDVLFMHFIKALESENEGNDKMPLFICVLEWLSFTCGQNCEDWTLKRTRRLTGSTHLLYVALEKTCDAIYITSEKEFTVIFDSEKPLEVQHAVKETDNGEAKMESPPLYTYIQTPEDITVVFRLPEKVTKSDIEVHFSACHLEILWRGQPVLKGALENLVDENACTWIISGGSSRLEVILCKAEVGLMWRGLVKGDQRGEEIMDPTLVEEIHSRLAHLTSDTETGEVHGSTFAMGDFEECDSCPDILAFLRIDGNSHRETHRINMGGHQWLFNSQVCPESLPVICLRHDVDGLAWQPKNTSSEGEQEHFKMEHIATFSAFGYVQASKSDKKFSSCAPNFSCSVISDRNRHVYIYHQPVSLHSSLELRNRRTGEAVSHVAKQYVINLEQCNEILGLQISNECIFVLSSNMFYAIKI